MSTQPQQPTRNGVPLNNNQTFNHFNQLDGAGKRAVLTGLLMHPALTVQAMIRGKVGFRQLKPARIIVLALLMYGFSFLVGNAPSSGSGPFVFFNGNQVEQQQEAPFTEETQNPGFDAPLPSDWAHLNEGTRQDWMAKHRLDHDRTQQQEKQRQKELEDQQADTQAKAASTAKWAALRAKFQHWPLIVYALAFLVWGIIQRRLRWHDLLEGIKRHTYDRGESYLGRLLKNTLPPSYVVRFAEPLALFIVGMTIAAFSRALGYWIMFSAFCLYIVEQYVFEMQLEKELDQLDALVEGEGKIESFRHWKKQGTDNTPATASAKQVGIATSDDAEGLSTSAIPDLVGARQRREGKRFRPPIDDLIAEVEDSLYSGFRRGKAAAASAASGATPAAPGGNDGL